MNPAVIYAPGDLIAVRAPRGVMLITDRDASPHRVSEIIAAIGSGNRSAVSTAADRACAAMVDFVIAWLEDDQWSVYVSGAMAAVLKSSNESLASTAIAASVKRLTVPHDAVSIQLRASDAQAKDLYREKIELAGGAVRARTAEVNLDAWKLEAAAVSVNHSSGRTPISLR